jgi:carbamoyltransferase
MHVLGINYSNDAAASLVTDGAVIAACQEERFRRQKHYSGFPTQAVDYCLQAGNISFEELDAVAFFWNPGVHAEAFAKPSNTPRHHLEYLFSVPNHLLTGWLDGVGVTGLRQELTLTTGKSLRIEYVTHHLAHAASAFYRSNYAESAFLTIDGYGEKSAATWGRAQGTTLETLHTVDFPHSVGSLYAAFTQYLGFQANNGEGKVMGLASYGKPSDHLEQLRSWVSLTDDGFELDLTYFDYYLERRRRFSPKLVKAMGPERRPDDELTERHHDIAFAVQRVSEEIVLHLARLTKERTGLDRLCMAGGVVLNCVANTRVQQEAGFDHCFFQPSSSDAGTSMGAALVVAHAMGAPRVTHPLTEYLGPSYDNDAVESALKKGNVAYLKVADVEERAAEALAAGHIIGWFQGRAEFGPRALGNRSILADPRGADTKDVLNARVKFREPFRPFAPSVLAERSEEYFDGAGVESPFMILVYPTRDAHQETLAAVTHVDGGARVQTVTTEQNPRYHRLIEAFGQRSGVPCVLNTSFNIRGEPIVQTPADALKCFFTTDMDLLFLGDFVVWKDSEKARSAGIST